jgi:hypothetical protein
MAATARTTASTDDDTDDGEDDDGDEGEADADEDMEPPTLETARSALARARAAAGMEAEFAPSEAPVFDVAAALEGISRAPAAAAAAAAAATATAPAAVFDVAAALEGISGAPAAAAAAPAAAPAAAAGSATIRAVHFDVNAAVQRLLASGSVPSTRAGVIGAISSQFQESVLAAGIDPAQAAVATSQSVAAIGRLLPRHVEDMVLGRARGRELLPDLSRWTRVPMEEDAPDFDDLTPASQRSVHVGPPATSTYDPTAATVA